MHGYAGDAWRKEAVDFYCEWEVSAQSGRLKGIQICCVKQLDSISNETQNAETSLK
jgi:hypothetical protein